MSEPSRRKLVAGNWKMNTTQGERQSNWRGGIAQIVPAGTERPVDVLVCPPFPYLCAGGVRGSRERAFTSTALQNDLAYEPPGAFTGEVAASMLTDVGCRFVIVGHSERRESLWVRPTP